MHHNKKSEVDINDLNLTEMKITLRDEKGIEEKCFDTLKTKSDGNRGSISFTIIAPAIRYSICGWINKLSGTVIG